jgi:hypothetical protein
MYPDPIRVMRFHYGDDVFEKIPLDKIPTGARSEIIDAMSKVEAKPVKAESPRTPGGYMTPGEIQANIEELENIERMIKRRESRFADMTDQEIKNELEHYGSQKNAFEIAFGYDHPEAYEQYIKSKPEKKAEGGPMGLDYLTGMEPPKNGYAGGGRVNFEKGSIPKMLKFLIDKLADEKNFNKTLLEKSNPKAIQELYIEQYGKLPSAEEIKDIVNKQLQNKGSMEVMNPKTGEVTTPKNPIMTVEDLQFKHKDAFKAHDQIFNVDINDKIAPDMIAESMAEMKGKDYFSLSQKEQSDLYKKALAYVDDVRMTKRQNKPIEGGFSFNDPDIKAQMEEAMTVAKKRGDEMRAMGLDPAKSKDYDEYIKIKETSGDKNFNKYFDDLEIKTKFKGVISDDLLNKILIEDNPQRKAEVIATIEQGLTMQEKGMSPEEIVNILKNTTRTKQAKGGSIGLNYLMGL